MGSTPCELRDLKEAGISLPLRRVLHEVLWRISRRGGGRCKAIYSYVAKGASQIVPPPRPPPGGGVGSGVVQFELEHFLMFLSCFGNPLSFVQAFEEKPSGKQVPGRMELRSPRSFEGSTWATCKIGGKGENPLCFPLEEPKRAQK